MDNIDLSNKIPVEILDCHKTLRNAGFEAYFVGGCVRDLILGKTPKDWDITTNARPEEIITIFPHTFYENAFGTVGVVLDETSGKPSTPETDGQTSREEPGGKLNEKATTIIEVTPYREEGGYSDGRHPDFVSFGKDVHKDLGRRDFTMNALAYDPVDNSIIDDYGGVKDILNKTIRTVGGAIERFTEDGLRVMRAIRFASQLSFAIDTDTEKAIKDKSDVLGSIAQERIRDEFVKMCLSEAGGMGIFLLARYGLLKYVIPELEEGLHVKQNQAHSFEVFEHLVRSFQHSIDKGYRLEVRIAALLHDIGKPRSRHYSEEKGDYTFYGHEVIGAKMAKKILERLKFSRETTDIISKLVRWHMFFSDVDQITPSAVRRMVANVGKDLIWDLIDLRICDRIGTGRPKEDPYRLRKYISMIEEVMRDPVSVGMLKISGTDIIEKLHVSPGPRIGFMLNILLEDVLNDPSKNESGWLVSRVTALNEMTDQGLKELSAEAIAVREAVEDSEVNKIRSKHRVK